MLRIYLAKINNKLVLFPNNNLTEKGILIYDSEDLLAASLSNNHTPWRHCLPCLHG